MTAADSEVIPAAAPLRRVIPAEMAPAVNINVISAPAPLPASSRRPYVVPFNNDVISAVRALQALTGKRSPEKEPRAFATDQAQRDKTFFLPAVNMMPCRGLSDSLKGISYSPHEYLYSWGPRITGFPEGKPAEMTSELAAGPYEALKEKRSPEYSPAPRYGPSHLPSLSATEQ